MNQPHDRSSRKNTQSIDRKQLKRAAKLRSQQKRATGEAAPLDQWLLRVRDAGRLDPAAGFQCRKCGAQVEWSGAGSAHRNHCPLCLFSRHLDNEPGDRASDCGSLMEPIGLWVRQKGEWAIIHRCTACGELSSNRIAADDNSMLLLSLAVRPLASPPFPLDAMVDRTGWPFGAGPE